MSEYLKIEDNKTYFLTHTITDWVDVFTRECYVNILIDSLKYCQLNKGLEIYAYVIMPTHVHMIVSKEGNLSPVLRSVHADVSSVCIESSISKHLYIALA